MGKVQSDILTQVITAHGASRPRGWDPQQEDSPWRDYRAMLQTRHQAATMLGMTGMEPWPADKAARLMAILYAFGNNEGFTLSPKFNIDREYIQHLYHIDGGEVPDPTFAARLREWVSIYAQVKTRNEPVFVSAEQWIRRMYDFQLYV